MTVWKIYAKNHQYQSSEIGNEPDKSWKEDFYFVIGSDPQLGMMAAAEEGYKPEEAEWEEEKRLARLSVEKVNNLNPKPRFFIICGDLTNEFPSEDPKSSELKRRQINDIKEIYSKVDPSIPLLCVCGHHDVGYVPTEESIQKFRSDFGDDYYTFWCGGVFFIVLNSQYFKNRSKVEELAEEQDRWIDEQLESAKGHRIVCFSHIRFITKPDDDENIATIPEKWRKVMLDKLLNAGVGYMFCGNYHKNFVFTYNDVFETVVTSAIGKQLGTADKSGMRVVKVSKDEITHKYYDFESFPENLDSF